MNSLPLCSECIHYSPDDSGISGMCTLKNEFRGVLVSSGNCDQFKRSFSTYIMRRLSEDNSDD